MSSPKKRKNGDTTPSNHLDQRNMDDVHQYPNAMGSTRSLWGHFGRGSNINLGVKFGGAAQSAPAGPEKPKSSKKPKHKASVLNLAKSPKKPKHKASAIDPEKSPRKIKHKASAIDLETAAAAARAATRRTTWLLADDDENDQEYA
jgi:hypothetical protein